MENTYLLDLLSEVKSRGGGMVLNVDGKSAAVVLSIDKYNELLLAGDGQTTQTPVKTVLVTGGAGYIGSHVVRQLLSAGHRVVVFDNLSTGSRSNVPEGITLVEADLSDAVALREVFSQYQFDAVIHLAASVEVSESVEKPLHYFSNNTLVTYALLSVMAEFGVKVIIFSSTGSVYGNQTHVPIAEDASPNPTNPYGFSKLMAEQVIGFFTNYLGFRATIFRYFNVCGAGENGELSDTHGSSHVVPLMLSVAAGKSDRFLLNGKDYETYDGTAVRDYVHVADVASAHVLALSRALEGAEYKIYNIGTGKGLSVEELLQAVAEVTGKMIPVEVGPRRPGDEIVTIADTQKIKTELGFEPKHSTTENIIQTAWKAFQ